MIIRRRWRTGVSPRLSLEFFKLYIVHMDEGICIRSKHLYTNRARRGTESARGNQFSDFEESRAAHGARYFNACCRTVELLPRGSTDRAEPATERQSFVCRRFIEGENARMIDRDANSGLIGTKEPLLALKLSNILRIRRPRRETSVIVKKKKKRNSEKTLQSTNLSAVFAEEENLRKKTKKFEGKGTIAGGKLKGFLVDRNRFRLSFYFLFRAIL